MAYRRRRVPTTGNDGDRRLFFSCGLLCVLLWSGWFALAPSSATRRTSIRAPSQDTAITEVAQPLPTAPIHAPSSVTTQGAISRGNLAAAPPRAASERAPPPRHARTRRDASERSPPSSPRRFLVMACAYGYAKKYYDRFLGTLQRSGYRGDVLLVSDQISPAPYGNWTNIRHKFVSFDDAKLNRYAHWSDACSSKYSMCLAADFRDTYFQANPFEHLPPPEHRHGLILSEEFRLTPPHFSAWNRKCVQACWGDFPFIKRNHSVCSGIIFGTPRGWKVLGAKMETEFDHIRKTKCESKDQGTLNYLFFTGALRSLNVLVQPKGEGVANNLGVSRPRTLISEWLNDDGHLTNKDGSLSPIVHQYDRVTRYWQPQWEALF